MSKKIWIPILGVLLAVAILLSPLSPVALSPSSPGATKSTAEIPLSIGEILDPSGNPFAHTFSDTKDIRTATYVVAASDSEHKYNADYRCDGTNDNVEIQAAIDALPATGGEVFLLDGTYNIEASLVLDSYQTLRGCGRNTILTTTTDGLVFLSAIGTDGSEKVHIVIADIQIDGAVGLLGDCGIYFEYVDHSFILNVYSRRHHSPANAIQSGIDLLTSDFNTIMGNACHENGVGILLSNSNNNIVSSNTCLRNTDRGIFLYGAIRNTIAENICHLTGHDGINIETGMNNIITANSCYENDDYGIVVLLSLNNTIIENDCQLNGREGIELGQADNNIVSSNKCFQNSQTTDNTYNNILVMTSDYNLIEGNLCRSPTIGTTLTVGEIIGATDIHVTDTTGFEVGMGVVIDLDGLGGGTEYRRISAIPTAGAPGVITIDAGLTNNQGVGETIGVPEARYGIDINNASCDYNMVEGNDLHDAGKTANFNDVGTCTIVEDDNREINQTQVKHMVYMKNTSAGNLVVGDVVSLKAVATGTEFTTPAGVGEDQVWGMLAENIDLNAWGYVQVKGGTTLLKATNAVAGNIAIGDFLCTEAAGTRAQKAGAGNMAFAIALEVCEAADVTIDALLIVPRKI